MSLSGVVTGISNTMNRTTNTYVTSVPFLFNSLVVLYLFSNLSFVRGIVTRIEHGNFPGTLPVARKPFVDQPYAGLVTSTVQLLSNDVHHDGAQRTAC